jgi:predicted transposase/invertase (TIGR01784 family)
MTRLNVLNDFAFMKSFGEKGDEPQLLAFLNAALRKTGYAPITEIEILEDRDLPADDIRGKGGKVDVLAAIAGRDKANVEVQLVNHYNMEKRSLNYWARLYTKGIDAGDDYASLPRVICINILDFDYLALDDFHTSFHIYEDTHKEYRLTDALEIHFLNMVKFRRLKAKDLNDPLHRWLVYFDEHSPEELVKEVIEMDAAIRQAQARVDWIHMDDAAYRSYIRQEKAARDEADRLHGARLEGRLEGRQEGRLEGRMEGEQLGIQKGLLEKSREIARKLKASQIPVSQIAEYTGLSDAEIRRL